MGDTNSRRVFLKNGMLLAGGIAGGMLAGGKTMAQTQAAADVRKKMFPVEGKDSLAETDPEFAELFDNFALDEVPSRGRIDDRTRFMAILATLLGCQGKEEYELIAGAALNMGVTPVEIREILYQAVAYLGIGRVYPFFAITANVFTKRGIKLPLPDQGMTTREDRREKGTQAQVDVFGQSMEDFWNSGPEETRHIRYWLAANCFGDYYTRQGLDLKTREMVTFCYLAAQGGCESQLTSHAVGNMRIGNDRIFLIEVISQCLPYIGYPRSLNALKCVEDAAAKMQ